MGSGISFPADGADETKMKEICGDKFDQEKFNSLATNGKISPEQWQSLVKVNESAVEFVKRVYYQKEGDEQNDLIINHMRDDCVLIRPSGNPMDKKLYSQMLNNKDIKSISNSVEKIIDVKEFNGGETVWVSFMLA